MKTDTPKDLGRITANREQKLNDSGFEASRDPYVQGVIAAKGLVGKALQQSAMDHHLIEKPV